MQKQLLFRGLAVGALIIILLIGLSSVQGIVYEPQARSFEVQQDIARSAAGAQAVTGPVLFIPYQRTEQLQWTDAATQEKKSSINVHKGVLHFLPDTLNISSTLKTEVRRRGIFAANTFRTKLEIEGSLRLPAHFNVAGSVDEYDFGDASLAIGIADIRGIVGSLSLTIDGKKKILEPGTGSSVLGTGIHAPLDIANSAEDRVLPFRLMLELLGSEALRFTPVGKTTEVTMNADWPHPSFTGEFLPLERNVSDQGFNATWKTTFMATNLNALLDSCTRSATDCETITTRNFGISLIDPVNHYALNERSTKYGLLFIVLTFTGFFLFEVLKAVRVHPVQYAFVGAGLVVFYLLLLSLSEHIGFESAYLVSSIACISLIGAYVRSVLGSLGRALTLVAGLIALYATLYTVLNTEDYALLMGSALLFGVLALAMVLTRKVDWFAPTKLPEVAS